MKARVRWLCAVALLLSTARQARADGPDAMFRLAWVRLEGAAGCVDQPALEDAVRARLQRDPFDARAERSIEGHVAWHSGAFVATLRVRDARGESLGKRELEHTGVDCAELSDAVALAIALTIDPAAPLSENPPVPIRESSSPPPSEAIPVSPYLNYPVAEPPPQPLPIPVTTPRLKLAWSLNALAAAGLLPKLAPGGSLFGSLWRERGSLRLGLLYFPERNADDANFAFGLSALDIGSCGELSRSRRASLRACADVQVGIMHAIVREVTPLDPGGYAFVSASLGPQLSLKLGRGAALELGVSALVPLLRPEFRVLPSSSPLFASAAVGALGQAGFSFEGDVR